MKKQQEKFARKSGNTFEDIARKWVSGNIRWNEAHAAKVLRSLELHVFPLIGKFPVSELKTADLLIPLRVAERKVRWKPPHGSSSAPRRSCVTRCRRG